MEIPRILLRVYCMRLEMYSVEKLEKKIIYAELKQSYPDDHTLRKGLPDLPDFIDICIDYLKKNSKKVKEVIRKNHNNISTMVYSVGLVVGNQIIQSGKINSMTVVYTVLMYLAKMGLDKVLADSKDSPDDTSDEGKGDTK